LPKHKVHKITLKLLEKIVVASYSSPISVFCAKINHFEVPEKREIMFFGVIFDNYSIFNAVF